MCNKDTVHKKIEERNIISNLIVRTEIKMRHGTTILKFWKKMFIIFILYRYRYLVILKKKNFHNPQIGLVGPKKFLLDRLLAL